MEKLLSIKEKLKSINSSVLRIEEVGINEIEKDILMADLRDVYVLISNLDIDNNQSIKNDAHEEKVAAIPVDKKVEAPKIEDVVVEERPDIIDFVDDPIVEESVVEKNEESIAKTIVEQAVEPKTEIKSEPVVEEAPQVEAPKQQNLFGNGNGYSNGNGNVKTVGESLGQNKTSLNERLAEQSKTNDIASQIRQKPVSDIKAAIGIGDRFLYIRELFNGNNDIFESTITYLNSLNSFDAASSYLADNFNWDSSEETVTNFVNVVRRKYL